MQTEMLVNLFVKTKGMQMIIFQLVNSSWPSCSQITTDYSFVILLNCCFACKFGQIPPVLGIYIKEYFRSTMGVGRLNDLAIIHPRRDIPIYLEEINDLL